SAPFQTPDNRFKHPGNILARELRRSTSRCSGLFTAAASSFTDHSFANDGASSCNDQGVSALFKHTICVKYNTTSSTDLGRSVDRILYPPSALKSAKRRIDLLAPTRFRLSASAIYVARIPCGSIRRGELRLLF